MPLEYAHEPERDVKGLIIRKDKPFNAEPQVSLLVQHYITPDPLFFHRNHGPIPDIDIQTHEVDIVGLVSSPLHLTVADLKSKFTKHTVMATLQCAGNRRDGLNKVKKTNGVVWGPGAVGNAVYTGCLLRDVLKAAGVVSNPEDVAKLHASFASVEQCEEDKNYGSSIPLCKALDEYGDVLLAYEMNGKALTRDHGYPIRVVVPGYIGARSVKYLKTITIQNHESDAYFQQRDYKILPSNIESEEQACKVWCNFPAIGEYNVQSYVCEPADGLSCKPGPCNVRGYALSGGGRSIQRVDVSADDGRTWVTADLYQPCSGGTKMWAWCLWTAQLHATNKRILSRAVDSAGNVQQEYPIWNYRGVMNNSWRTMEPDQPHL
ncbi:hypothetical protein INT44_008882 [Umbelopsis vinacea]|uniref:Sulfite oxidase n=1 Tax=Umbelopsis vinacea TaxID=44442 RepID=A0A8H7Q3A3_9FUNG|nr:hypothetical protein INT44_008882 [Umbelopsis vinacea]